MQDIKTIVNKYFVDVIKNKYFAWTGKADRQEFWMYTLCVFALFIGLSVVSCILGFIKLGFLGSLLIAVCVLGLICPNIALMLRRLRDAGFTPWLILVSLVPFIGGIALLVLLCLPSKNN